MRELLINKRTARHDSDKMWMLSGGPGGMYLADRLASSLDLKEGMRVLDIGPGHLVSSIFYALEYNVTVYACDLWVSANEMFDIIRRNKLEDRIIPFQLNINLLPFPDEYFDRIAAMGSYFYFGLAKEFTTFIARFLKKGGLMGLADGCRTTNDIDKVKRHYSRINGIAEIPLFDHYVEILTSDGEFKLRENKILDDGFAMWYHSFKRTYEIGLPPPWGNDNPEIIRAFENDREEMLSCQLTIVEKNRR